LEDTGQPQQAIDATTTTTSAAAAVVTHDHIVGVGATMDDARSNHEGRRRRRRKKKTTVIHQDLTVEKETSSSSSSSSSSVIRMMRSWTRYWKGVTPALLLCSNPSIHYTVYDCLKNQWLGAATATTTTTTTTAVNTLSSQPKNLSMIQAFWLGLLAKFVATMATYPLIRAKVILMVTSETSLWASLVRSYQQDGGIRGLYKGCDWQLAHTLLKSALMMMVREGITERTHRWVMRTMMMMDSGRGRLQPQHTQETMKKTT
jgi:hypothetical protein